MDTSKQKQQPWTESAIAAEPYEWSYMRVAEGTVINVVSAAIIGIGAIILGSIYAAAWALLVNVLHTPDGLVGILAFVLLGAVLMLIILVIMIVAWFRRMSSAVLAGMLIGAVIGAAIGAAIGSGKWKSDWKFDWAEGAPKAQEQKNTAKTEGE
jgi:xanthine/uracil/vitamin C permease (AzgA family)